MSEEPPINGVLDAILKNCRSYPQKPALHWLNKDGEVEEMLTYEEVEERTLKTARGLLDLLVTYHAEKGIAKHCVVLCYPPGLEFILTFIACLRAGIIAVPVCPPSKHHSACTTDTLIKIIKDCGAQFGLTNKAFGEDPSIGEILKNCNIPWHWEQTNNEITGDNTDPSESDCPEQEEDKLEEGTGDNWNPDEYDTPEQEEDDEGRLDQSFLENIIMLQYTSGSTGSPKGVINTNKCVLHNLELMKTITKTSDQMIELSYLPHYHDFGLFCSYLQPLYCGATGYYLSPNIFIEEPGLWISCLSKYKATHTQTPNFALELVLRKGYPKDIDLSCMQYMSNGSEPVYPETIARFESELAPFGLRKNTVRAGYGLAEHTVYVCGVMDKEDPLVINGRISCGKPLPKVTIKVANPETRTEVKEGEEGEVWVDSASKSLGYWKKFNETFESELENDSDHHYLRTGDLGFLQEGQLFISGRIKDVIVIHGRTIHPSDIEMRMESRFDLLRPGRTVTCEYTNHTKTTGVAYIAEIRSLEGNSLTDLQAYSMQIAIETSTQFEVNTMLVVLIKQGSMPRTTSGKRQRLLCKKKLLENKLAEVYRWAPSEGTNTSPDTCPHQSPASITASKLGLDSRTAEVSPEFKSARTAFLRKSSIDSKEKKHDDITSQDLVKGFNFEIEGKAASKPRRTSLSKERKHHDITSQDLVKQFNFEIEGKAVSEYRKASISVQSNNPIEPVKRRRYGSVELVGINKIERKTALTDSPDATSSSMMPQLPNIEAAFPRILDPCTMLPQLPKIEVVVPTILDTCTRSPQLPEIEVTIPDTSTRSPQLPKIEVAVPTISDTSTTTSQLPKIEVDKIVVPTISDPETSSPEAKIRKGSMIIPAISTSDVSVKSFSGKPKLTVSHLGLLSVQDNLRRKSAPPHEVDMEEKRLEDESRRKSVQPRKTMLLRQLIERRNSIQTLMKTIGKILGTKIEVDSNIWAHGCNSVKAVQLSRNLQLDFGFVVEPHIFYTHQTPIAIMEHLQRRLLNIAQNPNTPKQNAMLTEWKTQSLDRHLGRRRSSFGLLMDARRMSLPKILSDDGDSMTYISSCTSTSSLASESLSEDTDIAIVGMACSFAGCENTIELWKLLMSKKVATTSHDDPTSQFAFNGGFTKSTGRLDHQFFRMTEWEASSLDPQHSMLLHTVWECLHNSGYAEPLEDVRGSDWGVYVGVSIDSDAHFLALDDGIIPPATSITSSVAANRIARMFDLIGPSMSIDTACASSLSALHAACLSLRMGDCPAALVCGVNAILDKRRFEILDNMGMLAPDERCKVFDKKANGYVRGEGSGAVLLMPLWMARQEQRRVLAVIKSTATNNNGASSTTITAPHRGTQIQVLNKALSKSNIDLCQIQYIEAHGTGTKLGDPIEVDAIQNVLSSKTTFLEHKDRKQVYIGSVKANVGHIENGAGIAGLIKTVLVLEHGQIPGNPCLEEMNPAFELSENIHIPVDNVTDAFEDTGERTCAVVNSFGFGGTNATAVLQQFSVLPQMTRVKTAVLFLTECPLEQLPSIADIITALEERFPAFQQANKTCRKQIEKMELTESVAVFQLLYGISGLFLSLGTKFSTAGGTDLTGEILGLALAGAIKIPLALTLVDSQKSGNYPSVSKIQSSISKPSIPVFSCVLEKVCQPDQYESELKSEKYAKGLLQMLQDMRKIKGLVYTKALTMICNQSIAKRPILTLAVNTIPTELSEIEQSLPDNRISMTMPPKRRDTTSPKPCLTGYIREKCMKLRDLSDTLELEACTKKPSKAPQNTIPGFYQRYPLRALVDGVPKTSEKLIETETGRSNESGYLTQTSSTESVQVQAITPVKDMTKAPPPSPSSLGIKLGMKPKVKSDLAQSCIQALWKKERATISEAPEEPQDTGEKQISEAPKEPQDTGEKQKKDVLSVILKWVKDEVDDVDMTLDELAQSGLGLDSLNVMQLSDFLKKTYDVHFTYGELTELETLGTIAGTVVKDSPVLKMVTDQPTESPSPVLKTAIDESTESPIV